MAGNKSSKRLKLALEPKPNPEQVSPKSRTRLSKRKQPDGSTNGPKIQKQHEHVRKKWKNEKDNGEDKCVKPQSKMNKKNKKNTGNVGVKNSKLGGKVTISKAKKDDGTKQNKKKNIGGLNPVLKVKKGGKKNNNDGCGKMQFRQKCTKTQTNNMKSSNVGLKKSKMGAKISRETTTALKVGKKAIPKVKDLFWCPPKKGVLKWNTDASVRKDDRTAAIGGVLRTCKGSVRCAFSCPIDCFDINEAELRAIYKALELASCRKWLLHIKMVIESDSKSAVMWCNKDNGGPLKLRYMLSFIRKWRTLWPGLEITHVGRKSNSVADYLAGQGRKRRVKFVAWM